MKPGDLVVYPRKQDKTIAIGVVDGDYYWQQDAPLHRHRRPVKWLKKGILCTTFSQGALYEVGSAVTLFRVKNHGDVPRRAECGPSSASRAWPATRGERYAAPPTVQRLSGRRRPATGPGGAAKS